MHLLTLEEPFSNPQMRHLRTYAEDMLVLGDGSRSGLPQAVPKGGAGEGQEALMVAVAPDASCEEVLRLVYL